MKSAIFGAVAASALAGMVAIPPTAQARKHQVRPEGLVRGVALSSDECSQRALNLSLMFGQSGNGD
jgi:hypothetical protein